MMGRALYSDLNPSMPLTTTREITCGSFIASTKMMFRSIRPLSLCFGKYVIRSVEVVSGFSVRRPVECSGVSDFEPWLAVGAQERDSLVVDYTSGNYILFRV